jgi:EmrB/QacA subfamily drug resistance transporter
MKMMNETAGKKYILVIMTLVSFLTPFMGSSINVALPSIGSELSMDAVQLTWVSTAYLMVAAMLLVPLGRAADIYGRKKIFSYGMLFYTMASLFCALSPSASLLIASRALQGMGAAMIAGTGVAILSSVFGEGERGRALGINTAAVYLGLSLGPFIGGLLTEHLGWRSIFVVNVPLGLLLLGLVAWKMTGEWAAAKGEKFDLPGSAIYSIMLVAIMYGISLLPSTSGVWLILFGALSLLAFIKWETEVRSPVLDIGLFRNNRVFAYSNLAALIHYSSTFAVAFLLSLYLQYIRGFSPQVAGTILLCQPLVQAVFSPLAGRLSDRYEPRVLASAGMAVTVAGLVGFSLLKETTPLSHILVGLFVLGFGYAFFSSPNTNAVMSSVGKRTLGVASATLATMRQTGMTLSMGIVMLLFALHIGRAEITPEQHGLFLVSAKLAFVVFGCLCFGGVFASLERGDVR